MNETKFCLTATIVFLAVAILMDGDIEFSVLTAMGAICTICAFLGIGNNKTQD